MIRLHEISRLPALAGFLMLGFTICIPQDRTLRRPDPQTQVLDNYRRYPDRYIRISGETWKYDVKSRSALHSFTLKNNAGVAYSDIEIRLIYQDSKGKTLQSQILKIPGVLGIAEIRKIKDMKAMNVPAGSEQVLLTVAKGLMHP
jgi:hypothetical protein